MKDITRFSIVLFSICLVSASMLALVYNITEPRIIQQRKLGEERAIKEVLPQAPEVIERVQKQDLVFYKAKDTEDKLIAYVFITQARGYSSDIKTVVSLSPRGEIIAVKVLDQCETPGVGTRVTEEEFLSQFKDKNIDEQFDTITGATISSSAVIDSIKKRGLEILKYGE